jgi:glutamate N-acetyltransferase/amino-acid N-acetyltransferase
LPQQRTRWRSFEQENLQIKLGDFLLMENGQPLPFDRAAASAYLKEKGSGDDISTK